MHLYSAHLCVVLEGESMGSKGKRVSNCSFALGEADSDYRDMKECFPMLNTHSHPRQACLGDVLA